MAPSASPIPNSRAEKRFMTVLLVCVLLRARVGHGSRPGCRAVAFSCGCLQRCERAHEGVELEPVAVVKHGERVLAVGLEDAANLVAGEKLPVEVAPLVLARGPADVELVDGHDDGSSG